MDINCVIDCVIITSVSRTRFERDVQNWNERERALEYLEKVNRVTIAVMEKTDMTNRESNSVAITVMQKIDRIDQMIDEAMIDEAMIDQIIDEVIDETREKQLQLHYDSIYDYVLAATYTEETGSVTRGVIDRARETIKTEGRYRKSDIDNIVLEEKMRTVHRIRVQEHKDRELEKIFSNWKLGSNRVVFRGCNPVSRC